MTRAAVALAVVLLLAGCGDSHRVPAHGLVVSRDFQPTWVQVIPGTTMCSGNPPMCTSTPGQIIVHPDTWSVEIQDLKNHDWKGTVSDGNSSTYDQCEIGELWPECWGGEPK